MAGSSAMAAGVVLTGTTGGFTNPAGTDIDSIQLAPGATVNGNVVNNGTIGANSPQSFGIFLNAPGTTLNGAIINTGTITATSRGLEDAGLVTGGLQNSGTWTATTGLFIDGNVASTFLGGITNSGTITGTLNQGIFLSSTIFSGGITNSSTISGGTRGIDFTFTTTPTTSNPASTRPNTFSGGISNTGSISGSNGEAIHLVGGMFIAAGFETAEGTFAGGIANAGTLTGSTNGIYIDSFRSFSGGIVNNVGGQIIANNGDGIFVDHTVDASHNLVVTNFSGGVTNAGTISASANGIHLIDVSTFSGSISNSGIINANAGDGISLTNVNYSGTVSNSGTINATGAGTNGIFVNNLASAQNAVVNTGIINSNSHGIFLQGVTQLGGVTNSGTITSTAGHGMLITPVLTFLGGVTNTGTVTATAAGTAGIVVQDAQTFVGGVTNSGTVRGNTFGLEVGAIGAPINTFAGGIHNSGTITGNTGLLVDVNTGGDITNTGNITGTGGTAINLALTQNAVTIDQQAGTITGTIALSNFADIVNVTGGTVAGNITGQASHLGTVNFALGSGGSTIYANTISNVAAVNVNSGTLFLQGSLASNAVTIANGATLNVQNGGSITPGITDNGTLAIQRTTAFTYGGVISGSGVVQQLGPGTTTLTGTNTYAGGTQINGGILAVTSDANLGNAAGGLSFNGGTLQMGAGFTSNRAITLNAGGGTFDTLGNIDTLGGPIGGVGGLTVTGGGDLIVNGAGTYSGATNVGAGTTLSAGAANVFSASSAYTVATGAFLNLNNFSQTIGSLAGAGNVSLGSAVLTAGGDNTSTTYSGVIGGSGGFTKVGAGTMLLTGTNAYTGATNVNGGTLSVNGSIATSIVLNVNNGGTIAGNGTLPTTNINAGGTLSPGNSPGLITVAGNLTLSTAATYLVQISGTTADRTNVTGTAALAGTLQVAYLTAPVFGQSYTILHANGGRSGQFSTAATNSAAIVTTVTYTPTDVLLSALSNLSGGGGAGGANLNQNQHNVAVALDNAFNTLGTAGAFAPLFNLAPGALPFALTQLSGEIGTSAATASVQDMGQFLELMLDPFQENRVGGAPAGYGAPALSFAPETGAVRWPDMASAYARMPTKAVPMAPTFDARWTAWGAGYGAGGTFNGNAVIGSNNLTSRSGGIAAGLDYRVSPDTVIGFAAAGSALSYGLNNGLGSGSGDSFKAGIYGSTHRNNAYLSASAAYGHYDLSTDRNVLLPGVLDHLKASFGANSFGGRIEAGYRFPVTASVGVTPYAALQAQVFQQPNYVETDLSGLAAFALGYASRSFDEERSELGLRFDSRVPTSDNSTLLLRGRLGWAHEFSTNPAVTAGFVTLPGTSFVVTGAGLPRDALLVSAGPELRLLNGWTLRAKFDGAFASQSQSYAGTGTLRYTW